jgi:hypothetical protein
MENVRIAFSRRACLPRTASRLYAFGSAASAYRQAAQNRHHRAAACLRRSCSVVARLFGAEKNSINMFSTLHYLCAATPAWRMQTRLRLAASRLAALETGVSLNIAINSRVKQRKLGG